MTRQHTTASNVPSRNGQALPRPAHELWPGRQRFSGLLGDGAGELGQGRLQPDDDLAFLALRKAAGKVALTAS